MRRRIISAVCIAVLSAFVILSGSQAQAQTQAGDSLYAINLASYPDAVETGKVERLQAFGSNRLYATRARQDGKRWFRLRLGFFKTRGEAESVLKTVLSQYPEAWVVKVSEGERESAGSIAIKEGKPATGSGVTIPAKRAPGGASKAVEKAPSQGARPAVPKGLPRKDLTQKEGLVSVLAAAVKKTISPLNALPGAGKEKKQREGKKPEKGFESVHLKAGFQLTGAHEKGRCEGCHVRGAFAGTPRKCSGCHAKGGRISATAKTSAHIKTDGSCEDCHSTRSWRVSRVDHASLPSNCSSCHNGVSAKGKHIAHISSPNVCGLCHSTFAWTPAKFDHGAIAGNCSSCHNNVTAKGKSLTHIASANTCEFCHSTTAWTPAKFDHTSITGNCYTCHNGTKAPGKPAGHVSSSNSCEICHSTKAWTPAKFDHAAITGNCSSCHNGTTAPGKPSGHVSSSNTCELCHSTTAWTPAKFDHASITGNCSSCHNGTTAPGKPSGHVSSSNTCELCHSTTAWTPAKYDHTSITGNCSSCHNGTTATGKPSGHFVTTVQCSECHTTTYWRPALAYHHVSGNFPGNHNSGVTCKSCHTGNTQSVTWQFPAYAPYCAGCHADNFKAGEHRKVNTPAIYYTAGELKNCAGACHTYSDQTLSVIVNSKTGEHRASAGGW